MPRMIRTLRRHWIEFRLAMAKLDLVGEIDRHRNAMEALDRRISRLEEAAKADGSPASTHQSTALETQ